VGGIHSRLSNQVVLLQLTWWGQAGYQEAHAGGPLSKAKSTRQKMGLLTISEAADLLKIHRKSLQHYMNGGVLPYPTHKWDGKRPFFRIQEIGDMKTALKGIKRPSHPAKRKAEGLVSRKDLAKDLSVAPGTIGRWIKAGIIPQPEKTVTGCHYFSIEQRDRIKKQLGEG
jgi:DNA-binding transcriptional MerR regulator